MFRRKQKEEVCGTEDEGRLARELELACKDDDPKAYNFQKLWNDLEASFDTADAYYSANFKEHDVDPDNIQMKAIYDALKKMYKLGREAEKISFAKPIQKRNAGKKTMDVFTEAFGKERVAGIVGKKSMRMVEILVLPFVENASKVYSAQWIKLLCMPFKIDLDAQKEDAARMAGVYRKNIDAMKAKLEPVEENTEQDQSSRSTMLRKC